MLHVVNSEEREINLPLNAGKDPGFNLTSTTGAFN